MTARVAADLRAAAEVLRRDGWTQEEYHRPCGHCAQGAIAVATGFHVSLSPYSDDALDFDIVWRGVPEERATEARNALAAKVGIHPWQIPNWNDDEGRTADEVIAALEAAADAAEADQ